MFTGGLFVYYFVYVFEYGGLQSDAWTGIRSCSARPLVVCDDGFVTTSHTVGGTLGRSVPFRRLMVAF